MPLRYRSFWLMLGWLGLFLLCYFSLIPGEELPEFDLEYVDKLEHFLGYALLMGWFSQLYRSQRARLVWLVGLIALGGLLELLQGQTATRSPEWGDFLANSAGAALAYLVSWKITGNWLSSIDSQLHGFIRKG